MFKDESFKKYFKNYSSNLKKKLPTDPRRERLPEGREPGGEAGEPEGAGAERVAAGGERPVQM